MKGEIYGPPAFDPLLPIKWSLLLHSLAHQTVTNKKRGTPTVYGPQQLCLCSALQYEANFAPAHALRFSTPILYKPLLIELCVPYLTQLEKMKLQSRNIKWWKIRWWMNRSTLHLLVCLLNTNDWLNMLVTVMIRIINIYELSSTHTSNYSWLLKRMIIRCDTCIMLVWNNHYFC